MNYPLDLVFLDVNGRVLKQVAALRPWRMSVCTGAHATLELASGGIALAGIQAKDQLEWRET